jgi:uncharacterized membrane protein YagU involved in acid resistance
MSGFISTAARGAVAGAIGTWVMDWVTTKVLERQSPEDTERERAAWPNGKPSVPNLVDFGERVTGIRFSPEARPMVEQLVHYGLGVGPGILYALLRHRVPLLGAGNGVVYGLLLFALNDELLNTALGFAGPPEAYPVSSHARGLIGHVALGVTTDLALIGT